MITINQCTKHSFAEGLERNIALLIIMYISTNEVQRLKTYFFFAVFCFVFKTGFLCVPDCPETTPVDQVGLKLLRELPASASLPRAEIKVECHHHPAQVN